MNAAAVTPSSSTSQEVHMIKQLVIKDWQIYQKQFAAYVIGLLIGLTLIGMAKTWAFYAGGLLLLVLLICVGGFAIQTSLLNERKDQTLPFMMSLPITPMTFFWAKVLANVTIYLAPFTLVAAGTAFLVLFTPLPDGILVWSFLIYGFLAMNFFISLGVALVMESEGWNVFVQIAVSTLIGPFITGLGLIAPIATKVKTNEIVWSAHALGILAIEFAVIVLVIVIARALYLRKNSFL